MSAQFHLNKMVERSPYVVVGDTLREAMPYQWSTADCHWLSEEEKKKFLRALKSKIAAEKRYADLIATLRNRNLNEE